MNTKTKKKLCWNCEGNVSLQDEQCPYCGVSLDVTPIPGTNGNHIHFDPPYKLNSLENALIPPAPYASVQSEEEQKEEELPVSSDGGSELKSTVISLSLALLGTVMVLFSLILFIFSDNKGVLTLNWNGAYWYVYLLIGIPLFYLGWRFAASSKDS